MISPTLILSADHCMTCDLGGRNDVSYALLGVHKWSGYFQESFMQDLRDFFLSKPDYDVIPIINKHAPTTQAVNDIAIFVLERPAKLSAKICPILLPQGNEDFSQEPASMAGWGHNRVDPKNKNKKWNYGLPDQTKGQISLYLRKCETTTQTEEYILPLSIYRRVFFEN